MNHRKRQVSYFIEYNFKNQKKYILGKFSFRHFNFIELKETILEIIYCFIKSSFNQEVIYKNPLICVYCEILFITRKFLLNPNETTIKIIICLIIL